jgi:peptidoglycan hydrolase-like protein with peptidoglycan-binding domain
LQRKLTQLDLFEGKIDGYYGPQTARAIRAFEQQAGLQPVGALTRQVVEAIMAAGAGAPRAAVEPSLLPPTPVIPAARPVSQPQTIPVMAALPPPTATAAATGNPVTAGGQSAIGVPASRSPQPVDVIGEALQSVAQPAVATIEGLLTGSSAGSAPSPTPAIAQPSPPPLLASPSPRPAVLAAAPPQLSPLSAPPSTAGSTERELVMKVQRGLASLGFLAGSIDGIAGEATGKAIRNFEVYHNYAVTGRVTPELVGMLLEAGAVL